MLAARFSVARGRRARAAQLQRVDNVQDVRYLYGLLLHNFINIS